MLFRVWADDGHRPTRDLDLLGLGEPSPERCADLFREICRVRVTDDGLIFVSETVVAMRIKEGHDQAGVRVTLMSRIENARIPIQVDVGFGDAVVPHPIVLDYPTLLDQPAPRLRVYPMAVAVAEKLEAIYQLGMLNSRMKDFYEMWFLASSFPFESEVLAQAVRATFEHRGTELDSEQYSSLLFELGSDPKKRQQWMAFVNKGRVVGQPEFSVVIQTIERFMRSPITAAQSRISTTELWKPGDGWIESDKL